MFNRVTDDANANANSLSNAFQTANNAKLRIDREYYQMIEDLRSMGLSDAEIRRELKKNNIGGIKGVMRGKFEPFKVTNKNFQEMRRAGIYDQFPREEIQNIRRNMKDIPLAPDQGPPAPRRAPAPTPTPLFGVPADTAPTPMFGVPVNESRLQMPQVLPTQARAPGPVNPALLGDNPIDAALNAQIANRQG